MFKPAFADLSHHNSFPDSAWAQAKASGLVGVILKASEGTSYVDDTYDSRVTKARAAGLAVASYHYLKASADNAAQMQHFADVVSPAVGERLVIDFEETGLTQGDLEAAINELRSCAPYCEITVYGGQSFLMETLKSNSSLLASTSLWVARYTSADDPGSMPPSWPTWTAWQYTDGSVGGSPKSVPGFGKCDLNAFNGSPDNCLKWFGPATQPAPGPEPKPEPEPAEVTITTKGSVRVTVNGQVVTYE